MTTPETRRLETKIGFIGMGHMGSGMTHRLLNAGYPVVVYDRTAATTRAAVEWGATTAATPKELAANCELVLASVTNDEAQHHVMFGPDGALAGVHSNSTIIDLSTVSPGASRRLHQTAAEHGVPMIDAAVSGSVPQVEQGSLVIFVGGEAETYQRCRPILDVLGSHSFHVGPSGMGTTMKLVVNTLLGLGMQALAEAIALGLKAGIQKGLLLDVLGQTAVLTPGQKSKLENVRQDRYPSNFALSLMHKDFDLVLREAHELSVAMPATAAAQQMSAAAMARGANEDFSIMIRFMEALAAASALPGEPEPGAALRPTPPP
ncbi:MAG: NAD(P)-dependent oxidoreductase [Thermoplasmata archaeon]|nr:NAD(P)-dependent oxidoreductase [Thermoplasmata archaeon]